MAEAEEFEEDYEEDLIDSGLVGILDILNFKIVPKEPGDPDFSRFNEVIPPESRLYAAEYVRLQDKYDKLKAEMTAMASSSETQVREELTETKEALERERKEAEESKEAFERERKEAEESKEALERERKEAEESKEALERERKEAEESKEALERERKEAEESKEALERERKEAEESKEALVRTQMEANKANEALAMAQKEVEEANKVVVEEQGKVENLGKVVAKMQEQLNEGEKKIQKQKEEQEKLEQLLSSTTKGLEEAQLKITEKDKEIEESAQVNEEMRKRNEEMGEISRLDKENLDKIQKQNEKLEEDLKKSTTINSQLQEKISNADATNCELQRKLDALQEKCTETEDKIRLEIAKCGEYKTALEETTSNLNEKESQLREAVEIMTELEKAADEFNVLKTQFETVVQINLGLDQQVADLQSKLREKTSEVENFQRDLNLEREEKRRMETKLTRYRESLQSCNLELSQFIEELKSSIGFADEEVDPDPNSLQSRLESLSSHVKSKLKSREDNLKELKAELAKAKETILAINEHLQRQRVERMSMPPPPPPSVPRRAIMPPPPPVTNSGLSNTQSLRGDNVTLTYRDVTRLQMQEASSDDTSSTTPVPDFDFPSLEASHGIITTDFDDDSDFDGVMDMQTEISGDEEEVTLLGCRECGRTFSTWAELYQHQKTVHTVQMSKKVVLRQATSVKSLFGTFSTKQKKKKDISKFKTKQGKNEAATVLKIKIKQRKTRSGAHWNIVAPSPASSIVIHDGEVDNQNENTLMNERILSPSPEPLDQDSQNDDQNPSSSNQNGETDSPQHRPPLSEVSNSTSVGAATIVQPQQHGIDKTKSRNGSFCLCGKKFKDKRSLMSHIQYHTMDPKFLCKICGRRFKKSNALKVHLRMHTKEAKKSTMKSCELCGQKFHTKEQLRRHQAAIHPSDSQFPPVTGNRIRPDCRQNLEGYQEDSLSQDLINEPSSSAAPSTSTSTHHPQSAAQVHAVDTSKQNEGAFCVCGRKFSNKANLNVHIGYYTLEWKFECGICGQRFYYLTYLRTHYAVSHREPNILDEYVVGCRECGDMFRSRAEYRVHCSTKHSKSVLTTKPLKTNLRRHLRQPSSSQVISKSTVSSKKTHCQDMSKEHLGLFCVCGFESVDQNTLTKHIAQYSGGKKFDCNVCHQKFKLLNNLQGHLKVAHNAKKVLPLFGCQHCGKIFLSQSELLNHTFCFHPNSTRKHKNMTTSISKPTPERPVPLPSSSQDHVVDITRVKIEKVDPELEAITDQNTTGKKHGIDHSKKARLGFYCKCGLKSSGGFAKYNLQAHIKYANAERRFKCPRCQLRFKTTSRLNNHTRSTHNMEYTLKGCSICGKVFENVGALREHKKSQHRKKRKRIVKIDLTNVPTPAPQRVEGDLEELQQQDEEVITPTARTTTQQKILPPKKVLPSFPPQKAVSLPTLPKKKHAKDMTKRHLGYYCVCGAKTRNATALHGHIAYFTLDKKFECELCGYRSLYLAQLKRHLKSTHKLTNLYQLDQMGKGCSLCGKIGFATTKELTIHKMATHSILNDSTAQDETESVKPQPSTSKGLPIPTTDRVSLMSSHAKTPSIIISTGSLSITPVAPTSTFKTSRTPASPFNPNQADIRHAINEAKLNAGLFVCICGYTTNNRQKLSSHISYKTSEERYLCPICNGKFAFMSVLKRHMKRRHNHHNPHLSGCTTCSKVFSSKRELLAHSLSMHPQSNKSGLKVPQKPTLSTSPTAISSAAIIDQVESASSAGVWVPVTPSISVSIRTPTNGPGAITSPINPSSSSHVEPYSLSTAGGKSDEEMIIDAHLTYEPCIPQVQHEINHEMLLNGYYYCLCGQDFENTNALNTHVKKYSSDGKFICKTCRMAFLLPSYFRNHMLKVHKIVYNISNGCKHCGKNFATNMQLYEHFKMEHNNGQILELKYTPPTTSESQILSQELPYSQEEIIEIQDQNAQQKSREEEHAIMEQDPLCENKYFSCKCGQRCKSLVLVKRHIRNKKRQYIFKCYRCPATFNQHSNLKSHVVRVHKIPYEKGKYSCRVCAATFETFEGMKTHKKDVHGIS